jgi:phytoene dehydrogenase-like protein
VPARPNDDWDTVRTKIEKNVISDCARYYEGLDSLEIARRTLTPHDIEARFGAPEGNVYHVDPIITRFGPARPAMGLGGYKTPVPGLYLSGSGTHPIAGINGMPGMNAAKTLIKNLAKESGGRGPVTSQAPAATKPAPAPGPSAAEPSAPLATA